MKMISTTTAFLLLFLAGMFVVDCQGQESSDLPRDCQRPRFSRCVKAMQEVCRQSVVVLPAECTGYKTLTESDRSVQYDSWGVDGNMYQDRPTNSSWVDRKKSPSWSGEGWYRVEGEAGTRLSEQVQFQGMYRCATGSPGWMNAKHDDIGRYETKQVEFCFGFSTCHSSSDLRTQGKITNCNGFFVYYLPETHYSMRYCSVISSPVATTSTTSNIIEG